MDLELKNKVAIVTGGSKGIGKAIARELACEGADLVIAARGFQELKKTALELANESGRRVIPLKADTSDIGQVTRMVNDTISNLGKIDILINNAAKPGGQSAVPSLNEITDNMFLEEINVKVLGYLRCAQLVAPYMMQQRWGRIINISGMAARNSGSLIGSVRNVAVSAMTKNLADELGEHGINVTTVQPGLTSTEATSETIKRRANQENLTTDVVESSMSKGNSIFKLIDAREVAYVVAFLASPKSISITGDAFLARLTFSVPKKVTISRSNKNWKR